MHHNKLKNYSDFKKHLFVSTFRLSMQSFSRKKQLREEDGWKIWNSHIYTERHALRDSRRERGKLDEMKKISDERRRKLMSHAERERERDRGRRYMMTYRRNENDGWLENRLFYSFCSFEDVWKERAGCVCYSSAVLLVLLLLRFDCVALLRFDSFDVRDLTVRIRDQRTFQAFGENQ